MKKLVSFALALIMALSLCSFASAEEPTIVRFWHNRSSGANLEACQKAVDEFNNTIGKEKNIYVEEVYQGGYPEMYSKVQLASQTPDDAPTVAVSGNTYVTNLIQDDLLADMAPFAAQTGFDINNLLDCFQQIEGNTDGHLYSLPYVRSTPVLYYNKTMADAKGLTAPDTLADLEAFARALTEKNENGETTVYGFELLRDFGYINAGWLWEMGEPMLSTEGTSPALEGTSMLNHLTWWQNMVKEGICRPYDSTSASSIAAEMLVQGKLGCYIASSGTMKNLLRSMGEAGLELGVCYVPSYDTTKRTCEVGGGQLVLLSSNNDEKTLAAGWEFLQFLMSDEQVYNNSMATGYLPVTKSVANYDKMVAFWAENPTYKVPFEQMQNYGVCQEYPTFADLQEFIVNIQEQGDYLIQEQSITPEQAIEQLKDNTSHLF